jgi:hypothetical protein
MRIIPKPPHGLSKEQRVRKQYDISSKKLRLINSTSRNNISET